MSNRFKETAESIKLSQSIQKLTKLKSGTVVPIPIEYIDQTENIRHEIDYDSVDFNQLVDSIKEIGLLQNPVVTIISGKILCVSGHRRLAALEKLNTEKVPCSVIHFDSLDKKDLAQIVENTARKNLDPFDLGEQLLRLKEKGFSQIRLQELVGKNRQVVGRYQKLATWPEDIKEIVKKSNEKFTIKKLMELSSINDFEKLKIEIEKIVSPKKKIEGAKTIKRFLLKREKFDIYCNSNGYSKKEIDFLNKALVELKVIGADLT